MLDLLTILLIAFIILLGIQIFALVRIKQMVVRLRTMLTIISPILQRHNEIQNARKVNMRICQFCKYRQAYIKTTSPADEEFYYRCRLKNKEIVLTDSCNFFELESEF